jgi:hypothetical protein
MALPREREDMLKVTVVTTKKDSKIVSRILRKDGEALSKILSQKRAATVREILGCWDT